MTRMRRLIENAPAHPGETPAAANPGVASMRLCARVLPDGHRPDRMRQVILNLQYCWVNGLKPLAGRRRAVPVVHPGKCPTPQSGIPGWASRRTPCRIFSILSPPKGRGPGSALPPCTAQRSWKPHGEGISVTSASQGRRRCPLAPALGRRGRKDSTGMNERTRKPVERRKAGIMWIPLPSLHWLLRKGLTIGAA